MIDMFGCSVYWSPTILVKPLLHSNYNLRATPDALARSIRGLNGSFKSRRNEEIPSCSNYILGKFLVDEKNFRAGFAHMRNSKGSPRSHT